jgi:hypothetical protein
MDVKWLLKEHEKTQSRHHYSCKPILIGQGRWRLAGWLGRLERVVTEGTGSAGGLCQQMRVNKGQTGECNPAMMFAS